MIIRVKTRKRHIWYSSLLTIALLFQLGFTTIHVFTSHAFHSQIEVDNSNEAISGADTKCDLCAKLSVKSELFILAPEVDFTITFFQTINALEELTPSFPTFALYFLRGPPTDF
jgi:hypothetical protein